MPHDEGRPQEGAAHETPTKKSGHESTFPGPIEGTTELRVRVSPWLRRQLDALQTKHAFRLLDFCEHLRADGAAAEVLLAVWSEAAVCPVCAPRLALTAEEDRTCDRCGLVCALIYPHVVRPAQRVLVAFGLCEGCCRTEIAA